MATEPSATGVTYADLLTFPEDGLRREVIDGELFVTAAPAPRHQLVVAELVARLVRYRDQHGGEVLPGPVDVYFSDSDVVEPDVIFIRADSLERVEERLIRGAPDVVVEISSPTTRQLELKRKRDLYEREGVPEYVYVDIEAARIEVYRLREGGYGLPTLLGRGDTLRLDRLPGFVVPVEDLLRTLPA